MQRLYEFALNPWVVILSLSGGFLCGILMPKLGTHLAFVVDIYVDLLKMIALPFMVAAVIFSLQRLFREGASGDLIKRVTVVFFAFAVTVAILGVGALLLLRPGENVSTETIRAFGNILGQDPANSNTAMNLYGLDEPIKPIGFSEVLVSLVPSNVFAALANGETLKALVFALLFGVAVGQIPSRVSEGLTASMETVYHSCQLLMRWLNYPLPIILFCMGAAQMAKMGLGPLQAMAEFVLAFSLASLASMLAAALIIWKRSGTSFGQTFAALQGPFALAVATRNSAACIPSMIEALADKLGFARTRVELLVPLSVSLLRIGPIVYYVCAAMFIAQLYDKQFGFEEILITIFASVLAGFASAGMTGLLTVSLLGLSCQYLGLPFEAAFVLFLAVDPICDMLRTMVLVIGNSAAVSLICPRPLKL
jgi:Na+/H+-dicarboxylate symporter